VNNKDVIYIDVEDEITQIIEKVSSSKSKIVALVLPKRATVFQSVVNMKLLKRKASQVHKQVVLVTSEPGLMPLAGAVKIHVAKSLQDQPEIPPDPNSEEDEKPLNLSDDTKEDKGLDGSKPIGELAGLAAVGAVVSKFGATEDTIEFDNDAIGGDMGLDDIDNESKKPSKKSKKLNKLAKNPKIPNFDKFRKMLILGVLLLLVLIGLYIFCFKVLPKATIVVQTNTASLNSDLTLTLSQSNQNLDSANDTVPAKFQTITKTATSPSVNTTGTKVIGTSATGTITISNDQDESTHDVPQGTVFSVQGSGGSTLDYATTQEGTVPAATCLNHFPFTCSAQKSQPIPVASTSPGAQYNIGPSNSYTTSYSGLQGNFNFSGSTMANGTSENVQAVAQADITSAQNQLTTPNSSQMEQQLESNLRSEGYIPVTATYVAGTPTYTPTAAIGTQANSITVTENVMYSMYGVKEGDIQTLIDNNVNLQINSATQSILDSGASGATFSLQSTGTGSDQVTMQASSTIGPKLNASSIASESTGQKSGDIKSTVSQIPGVTNVTVKYSPFWVSSTPKNVKKITVVIEKANGSQL